jgi:hypothetical protein
MGLLIRTLLIWLLVLAVPAQGAAAATMAFCGPNHHGGGAAAQMQLAAPANHAHHDGAIAAEHEHPQAEAQADKGSSASAASAKVSDSSKHKCSACASCCSIGAILSSVLAVPAPVFTPTVFSTVVPGVDTFAADGPDRPPRIVLA